MELVFLGGRSKLADINVHAVCTMTHPDAIESLRLPETLLHDIVVEFSRHYRM